MPDAELQALIDRMDPEVNYGTRTHRQAIREASVGLLLLSEGEGTQPVIKSVETGQMVSGTGRLPGGGLPGSTAPQSWEQIFEENAEHDMRAVKQSLIDNATGAKNGKPDTKAIIYYLDRMMGRPKEMVSHGLDKRTEELFKAMTESKEVALAPGDTKLIDWSGAREEERPE